MDFQSIQNSELLKNYTKCGFIYKTSLIREKQHILLSCLHCNDVFWQLENFLEHWDKHSAEEDIFGTSTNLEEDIEIQEAVIKMESPIEGDNEILLSKDMRSTNLNGEDPLDEYGYDYTQLLEETIKVKDTVGAETAVKDEVGSSNTELNSADDIEPQGDSVEDFENPSDSSDEDDVNEDDDDNEHMFTPHDHKKLNLRSLTKNRSFVKSIIEIYKQHAELWDSNSQTKSSSVKSQALKSMTKYINTKNDINITTKQVEMIIKLLRMRFMHQYYMNRRCRNRGDDDQTKTLWFYDKLKFIEPHIKNSKQNLESCDDLTDELLLILIKLLKENDCLWNEDNIYHTSVIYKQSTLQDITNSYAILSDQHNFSVDDMRNLIEELKVIVIEENRHKLENSQGDEYQPSHRFYTNLQFLSPHVGPFNCGHCEKSFMDIYTYKFHVSKHEGTKPFKCMVCEKELTHKKEFMCHLRRHTNECPFKCDLCDKSFPSKKERQRHVIKHGSKPYVCELCADSFYTQHQLTNHMKNHANIRDHVCAQCGKGFTHRGLLRQHQQTHNKIECVCPLCNNVYANPRSLRKHYVRVHEVPQEASGSTHNCKICMITFPTILEAKQHRKEHKQSLPGKRKHVCDICGHDFAYPRNLADHKKTHSNVRDQVCDVCGKAFTNTNLLNQHKNVHNGQKFICKVCGKDYAHYRGLCRHINKVHNSSVKEFNTAMEMEELGDTSKGQ